MLGTTIKDFKLVERLGKGGWGEVWAGEQQLIKTRVAIKLLDSEVSRNQEHVKRFFNEAIAAGKIPHAGIVKIFDVGFHEQQAFLIMELLAGETLAGRIRRVTRMSLEGMIEISRQIAGVLAATHDCGITHRDLKPDNIFLIPDAELPTRERVKVLDFGIAKLGATSGNTDASSMGTPAYMAPEQWRDAGSADARSDVYSLGCVMFEMCCGRPPFVAASTAEACTQHLQAVPPHAKDIAPALPNALDDLIDRMLAKSPDDRPTLVEVSRVLETSRRSTSRPADTLLAPSDPRAVVPATVTSLAGAVIQKPPTTPAPRSRRTIALAALGIATVAGAATTIYVRRSPDRVNPPALGLKAVEDYGEPTPNTLNNRRSDALWSAAQDDFSRACADPDAEDRWCAGEQFASGQLALIRDQVPEAVAAFRTATLIDPAWATAQVGLSHALAFEHDLAGSLAAARKAQALEPSWWQAAAASARAYLAAGNVDDSLIEFRRALSLSPPDNAVLLGDMALAYHYAHQDVEATKLADAADKLDRSLASVHVMRAERALEIDDANTALTEAESALALSPKNGPALIARADALVLEGRTDDARAVYQRVVALKGGLNIIAINEGRLGRIQVALQHGTLPEPRHAKPATSTTGPATGERTRIVGGDDGKPRTRDAEDHAVTVRPSALPPVAQQPIVDTKKVHSNEVRTTGSTTPTRKRVTDPKNDRTPQTPDLAQ